MTQYQIGFIKCPNCNEIFTVSYPASINTWLNPELIEIILNEEHNYTCSSCNTPVFFDYKILINCSSGMFYIRTGDDLETKKKLLLEHELIDENGIIPTLAKDEIIKIFDQAKKAKEDKDKDNFSDKTKD